MQQVSEDNVYRTMCCLSLMLVVFIASYLPAGQVAAFTLTSLHPLKLYVCEGDTVRLQMNYTLEEEEDNVTTVSWATQTDLAYEGRLEVLKDYSLLIRDLLEEDSGLYTFTAYVMDADYTETPHSITTELVVFSPPKLATNQLQLALSDTMGMGVNRDGGPASLYILLICGLFLDFRSHPVTIMWATPHQTLEKTSFYRDDSAYLAVPLAGNNRHATGRYTCFISRMEQSMMCTEKPVQHFTASLFVGMEEIAALLDDMANDEFIVERLEFRVKSAERNYSRIL